MTPTSARRPRLPSSTRFEFQQPIGTGSTGTVYRALDRRTGQPVAIKVLRVGPSERPDLYRRLALAFGAAAGLDHPNIARPLALEAGGDVGYVVSELVEGGSLLARVEQHGRVPEDVAVRVVTQVAQALHYAHRHGVVHRDVSPANVLLLPDGRAKLTDFGLVKDDRGGARDQARGADRPAAPPFTAPELLADPEAADARSDVYSLAATLHHAAAGRPPSRAAPAPAVEGRRSRSRPAAPTPAAGLSGRADAAIRAALDPDPARRPASCLEFVRLLTARRAAGPAAPAQAPGFAGEERRGSVRFALRSGGCAVVDPDVHAGGPGESWPLVVRDVSAGGAGVLLARRFEPGTELAIELAGGPGAPARRLPARVVRVRADRGGCWVHGCAFDPPLDGQQLAALLRLV